MFRPRADHWQDCCSACAVIRPAPPAVIVLAATVLTVSESPAAASSINVLQPGSQSSTRPLFDLVPTQSADDRAIDADRDCVAVADETRKRQAQFGTANWTRGRLSWDWEPGDAPVLVYLMCVNRQRSEPGLGGLEFGAGLSWGGAPMIFRRPRALGHAGDIAAEPIATSFEIGETPFISWPVQDDISAPSDDPNDPIGTVSTTPVLFDIPVAPSTITSLTSSIGALPGAGTGSPALLDNPIDPSGSLPVPEPGTWILMATGLAVAWKFGRRRR
jgi:hypothetical protein